MLEASAFAESEIVLAIRPNDYDYAAYLNNAVYVEFLEAGRVDWAGRNRLNLLQPTLAPAVVRLELDYLRGIIRGRDPDQVVVRTALTELKLARLIFNQFIHTGEGNLCARALVQVVMLNLEINKAVAAPDALERLRLPG
ncbi:acyl-CoA thioesterase [Gloeobacter kilaueensis]|uniref:Acyl-CoA thioesterase YbgC n=1 Tax=Gloeobacter kilaueensis (strain ATCC BAA-2537 / CCAP 1431/1 / ULC 316 / JS1) TaxID=1183438 RepID=U5QMF7_GLOK1|nr:acyl-CoA thioesterase [Gloeobacter kilaueensis]AGY58820.1 acyl-CoA thioesterase YbgC [Gloeobacter kilaueensis JS1]